MLPTTGLNVCEENEGRVVVVEFDHGKANEMGTAQIEALEELCTHLESGVARALVTYSRRCSSKGTPIFVAGANVTERAGWSHEQVLRHVDRQRRALARLRRAPVFHVAVVHGIALGWGTEFTLTADWRVAVSNATFGLPETGLGIVPGAGGTSELWAEIGVGHALRLGMTGTRLSAEDARAIGLAHEVVGTVDEGLEHANTLIEGVLARSPTAVAAFKRGVLACVGRQNAEREQVERAAYQLCVESGEAKRGREAFAAIREGRTPEWGALQAFTDL